ncbi:MAG: hypothetical protein Q4E53_12265, partial [Eubacteriales bacterium]|nr:hypothetical protein [Eubacteriales bacterium]
EVEENIVEDMGEDICFITPEEFEVTNHFEGITGYDFVAGMDFDFIHGYVRDSEDINRIYMLRNVYGYQVIIPIKNSMDFKESLDDITEYDEIDSIFVNLCSTEFNVNGPVGLCLYQPDWQKERTDIMESVKKGKDFIAFLEGINITRE